MSMKEFIAYRGEKFTVEWYYNQKDESQPLDFFNKLSCADQQKFFHLVKRYECILKKGAETEQTGQGMRCYGTFGLHQPRKGGYVL